MNIQKIKMASMLFMASLSITLVGIACQPVENSTGNSNGIEQSSSFSDSNKNTESESSSLRKAIVPLRKKAQTFRIKQKTVRPQRVYSQRIVLKRKIPPMKIVAN